LVLPIFEKAYPKDDRPRKAIEAARAYALNPSKETAYAAHAAARAADVAYAAAPAAAAANAAANAAYAAADAAAYAATAAAYADYAAADAADKKDIQAKCVAIVRKHFPILPR
jgi:predicted lipid-binding transport protein (Tim44 family)